MTMNVEVIGLVEDVNVNNQIIKARIDTGAKYCSIAKELVEILNLKSMNKMIIIRSSNGTEKRKMVKGLVQLAKKDVEAQFTVADRSEMTYKMLIGQDVLKQGFVIDPKK